MRVVLHNLDTGLFLQTSGEWTADAGLALEFGTVLEALNYAQARQLSQNMEIWLSFEDADGSIRMRI